MHETNGWGTNEFKRCCCSRLRSFRGSPHTLGDKVLLDSPKRDRVEGWIGARLFRGLELDAPEVAACFGGMGVNRIISKAKSDKEMPNGGRGPQIQYPQSTNKARIDNRALTSVFVTLKRKEKQSRNPKIAVNRQLSQTNRRVTNPQVSNN